MNKRFTPQWLQCAFYASFLTLAGWTACAQLQIKPAQPSAWPGFKRGDAQALRITGKYAYLGLSFGGVNGGLSVVDIRDPAKPVPVGGCDASGVVCGLDVAGGYAYLASASGGFEVFDVRDSANPARVGGCNLGGSASDVRVVNNHAYVAITGVGLAVFDVSEPSHPAHVATCALDGWSKRLQVVNNFVYVAFSDRLEILGLSSATNLSRVGTFNGSVSDVDVAGHWAFLTGAGGLEVLDVSHPTVPVLVTNYYHEWSPSSVKVAGDFAYVGCMWGAAVVFDIHDPTHPVELGMGYTGEFTEDVDVSGQYAYAVATDSGLQVFDVSNPKEPVRVGGYAAGGTARFVQLADHYAFLTDGSAGLEVIDVSNPASPAWVGGYFTGNPITGLQLFDHYALISLWGGLWVLDVSQPTQPQFAGSFAANEMFMGFQKVGAYVYAACDAGGLRILDLSNPTHPVCLGVGTLPDYGYVISVRVDGARAYVAIDRDVTVDQGVFDVSDPCHPVFLGTSPGTYVWDAAVVGHYRLVADSTPTLKVYDASDPTNLVLVSSFSTSDLVYGITVQGTYAYLAEGYAGVQVIDVSAPTNLVTIGQFGAGTWVSRVVVSEQVAYVPDARNGLIILPISLPKLQLVWQVQAAPGVPFTVETATELASPGAWAPLFTTNMSRMPFWFSDSPAQYGRRFYRARQPAPQSTKTLTGLGS